MRQRGAPVPRAGPVSGGSGRLEAGCDRRPRRAAGGQCCGSPAGPPPGQGIGAGASSQGQGAGRNGRLACAVKKTLGGLPPRRGRMTRLEDRRILVRDIEQACAEGARLAPACTLAGINARTLRRWNAGDGLAQGDRRPDAERSVPAHALTKAERARIIAVANEPRFAETPPARIVPTLADEGVYIASESSFYRVLREHGQMNRRGRAQPPRASRPPTTHIATGPAEVWCWDVTFLPAQIQGRWFYLYLILDLYSRKIVGFEVHDTDSADHAARLARRTALAEAVHAMPMKPVLHGDNGATLKGTTVPRLRRGKPGHAALARHRTVLLKTARQRR